MLIGQSFTQQQQQGVSTSHKAVQAIGMIAAGEALHYLLPKYAPISKSLWTPSFVLVSSGTSVLKYLAVEAVFPYLPAVVRSVLEAVGRRSLEVYVVSTLLTMLFKYGGDQKSVFARGVTVLKKFVGQAASDFLMSASLTAIVAASAVSLVSHRIRLQW
jgi:predicted acyltransferase